MSSGSKREALEQLRGLLANLVQAFELDDPEKGLVGVVPVIGGKFLHPLTREPIEQIKVYGAGADRVKIAEPKFLRSLPSMPVTELTHPSQLCAGVAKTLSEFLSELGQLRNQTKAMGLDLDLERDVLRLRGKTEIDEVSVELITRRPDKLVLMLVGDHHLSGKIPREERTLVISGDAAAQKETLAGLVHSLNERVRRTALENVERKLGLDRQPQPAPIEPAPAQEPPKEEELPTAPPPSPDTQTFASGPSEVLELFETVETQGEVEAQPAPPPEESLGAVGIKKLFDVLGGSAEVSAHGGKLRLVAPLKVVQGLYNFYLEQRGPTQFKGFLVSPQGTRHTVEFDLRNIEDIKQVFDRVLLGRQDFV
jgi:hypothetical protein